MSSPSEIEAVSYDSKPHPLLVATAPACFPSLSSSRRRRGALSRLGYRSGLGLAFDDAGRARYIMAAMLRARILATPANKPLALLPSPRTSALPDQGSNDAKQCLLSRWDRCWRRACQVRYFWLARGGSWKAKAICTTLVWPRTSSGGPSTRRGGWATPAISPPTTPLQPQTDGSGPWQSSLRCSRRGLCFSVPCVCPLRTTLQK